MSIFLNIVIFLAFIAALVYMQKKNYSFNVRVITGMIAGIFLGFVFSFMYSSPESAPIVKESVNWFNVVGNGYVRLLRMIVIPLIFLSITTAIVGQKSGGKNLAKTTTMVLIVLLATAAISAAVGGATAKVFNLTSQGLQVGESESSRELKLQETAKNMAPIQETLVSIIPTNPFYALTGQGSNATLSVVLFAVFVGLGVLAVRKVIPEHALLVTNMLESSRSVVLEIVMMVLTLTPFGIFALMTTTVLESDFSSIMRLGLFVIASYVAIFIMFIIHALILMSQGLSPIIYFKKSATALTFAFTSRTSAGTLPLTTRSLIERMGVSEGTSNLAATLGTSIGQNGCAGIYPAMLVMMVAPSVGVEITPLFFLTMILVVTLTSIGIAGVGGGATFAGITVLAALGLPVGVAGVLIAIEPLIDMARTALNVSDSMVAALVASNSTKELDKKLYNAELKSAEFSDGFKI